MSRIGRSPTLTAGGWILALALGWPAGAAGLFAGFAPEDLEALDRAAEEVLPGGRHPQSVEARLLDPGAGVRVDGRLDDDAWRDAPPAGGFRQWDPERGAGASEETLFKVAYDGEALYFAVACLERDPGRITGTLSRRDQIAHSDYFAVFLDPYCDRETGYCFRVNPLGVQQDAYLYNDGESDGDWDAVWQAETWRDDDGWYAEVRIPFSAVRYRADSPAWGLQVSRHLYGRGETSAWVVWDPELAGFVSRFGSLEGLRGIPAPRRLEALPYVVARTTDPAAAGPETLDHFQNFGLDLKYGVTADLTLNAAIQPDFGQVEADPATLNLSPFETYFAEKRPFFVEGSRFFQHRRFDLFHSRRIGGGRANARIRYAAKLTGKTGGGISLAALAAGTDVTGDGRAHNFLRSGSCPASYWVGRIGKELPGARGSVNLMQTAALRGGSLAACGERGSRDAYTTGADAELLFRDRSFALGGSFVGSIVDAREVSGAAGGASPAICGSGGSLWFVKRGGKLRGQIYGGWETGRLDLNDLGYLQAPDEIEAGLWIGHQYTPDGGSRLFHRGSFNLNLQRGFLYEPRAGRDLHTGEEVWSYRRGHRALGGGNVNGWIQWRSFAESWFGVSANPEGCQRWDTRDRVLLAEGGWAAIPGGGPLIREPATWGGWLGGSSDTRRPLVVTLEGDYFDDQAGNATERIEAGLRWKQSNAMAHSLQACYRRRIDDTQHLANYENPGGGIGGVSYVYGDLRQEILHLTLRTSLLFSRNQSLEVYARPYMTVGDYRRARELARPDSYDLRPYQLGVFDVDCFDFAYSAVHVNAVYRWQYRPGSTIYLVWTHGRESWDQRGLPGRAGEFEGGLSTRALWRNEPENAFLVKVTYWMPV